MSVHWRTTSRKRRAIAVVYCALIVSAPHRARAAETTTAPGPVASATPSSAAQASGREGDAVAAMERGIAAYGKGDPEGALREYEQAKLLAPAANVPYRYAAVALVTLGRYREAIDNLNAYLAKNPAVSDAEAVRTQIQTLTATHLPGSLVIRVHSAHKNISQRGTDSPAISVRIDGGGATVLRADTDETLALEPGRHTLVVQAPDVSAEPRAITIVGGQATTLRVDPMLTPAPASSALATWGLITGGVGLVTVATASVLDATVLHARIRDLDAAALRGDPTLATYQADARSFRTGVVFTYVSGIALVLVGAGMWLLAPKKAPPRSFALRF